MRHTRQNQFHGSTGRPAPPRGGQQTVTARHTLGIFDCWCQGDICTIDERGQQWWPGKDQGFPHPREKDEMSTEILEHLDRSDVKMFAKPIQDLVMTLVNECHVRYRMVDSGQSMLLYPPDGISRPFKISSKRPFKSQLGFLQRQFIDGYDIEMPKKEKPVGEPTTTFSAPAPAAPAQPRPAAPPSTSPFGQATAVKVEDPPVESSAAEPTEEWQPYMGSRNGGDTGFDTDGKRFRCRPCFEEGKEAIFDKTNQLAGHKATAHNGALWAPDAKAKATLTARENRRRAAVEGHLRRMAEVMEIDWPGEREIIRMRSTIERLEAKVAALTAERDEALEAATNPETGNEALIAERDLALAEAERAKEKLSVLRAALAGDDD